MHITEDQKDPTTWDKHIAALDGHLNHSSFHAELRRRTIGGTPVYLSVLNDEQQTVGAALASWRQNPRWPLSALTKSLVMDSLPLVRDNVADQMREILLKIEAYAQQHGAISLTFGSQQNNRSFAEFESLGYQTQKRYEFRIDLSPSEEALWSALKSSHRRKIRKAMAEELEIIEGKTLTDLMTLQQLQFGAKDRAQKRGDDFGVHGENYYQAIKSVLVDNDVAKVYIALYQGKPVSAVLITIFNQRAVYKYGGTNEQGYSLSTAPYLLWESILRAREMGCIDFNLGGVPGDAADSDSSSHGLYRFKRGFGSTEMVCVGGLKILRPRQHQAYQRLRGIIHS